MYLSKVLELEDTLKLRLVTGAFEIVNWLFVHGPTNSRDLARQTKVSPANFQMILKRLREDELVVIEVEEADKRKRRYALAPDVQRHMCSLEMRRGVHTTRES